MSIKKKKKESLVSINPDSLFGITSTYNSNLRLPRWRSGNESPASAGDTRDAGLVSGSGRSPEKEVVTHSSILVWEIPWTEEPGGLQSMG